MRHIAKLKPTYVKKTPKSKAIKIPKWITQTVLFLVILWCLTAVACVVDVLNDVYFDSQPFRQAIMGTLEWAFKAAFWF